MYLKKDTPIKNKRTKYKNFYNWVINFTDKNSTFSIYYQTELHLDFQIVFNRSLFATKLFPFREDFFFEYKKRYNLLYGKNEILNQMKISSLTYYQKLTPKNFIDFSNIYSLDYIIIEKEHKTLFKKYNPVFQNNYFYVYDINNL
jgi:hypothetical protein